MTVPAPLLLVVAIVAAATYLIASDRSIRIAAVLIGALALVLYVY